MYNVCSIGEVVEDFDENSAQKSPVTDKLIFVQICALKRVLNLRA